MNRASATSAPPRLGTVRGLVGSCHPLPCLAVTTVAVVLSAGVGLSAGRTVVLGAAVLSGQLSIGWSNDRIDSDRDTAVARSDKPLSTGLVAPRAVAIAAGIALLSAVILNLLLGLPAALAGLTGVAAGWAYNLGLKSTLASGIAYVVGFGTLPAQPYLALPGHPWPPWWVPVTGALLGFAAHFANALPDLRDDAATGVRGLPQRLGARAGVVVMALTLAAASIVLGYGPSRLGPWASLGVSLIGCAAAAGVVVLARTRPQSAAAFRLTMALAVFDVVLVVAVAV